MIKELCINFIILGTTKTCKSIKESDPSAVSGIYEVEIQGEIIELFCEMQSSGGGWAVSIYNVFLYFCNFIN